MCTIPVPTLTLAQKQESPSLGSDRDIALGVTKFVETVS